MPVSIYRRAVRRLLSMYESTMVHPKRPNYAKEIKRVKLVAIAKNESAYLCEWIFHHLYFGFSEIDIYFNGCTDNTCELITLLKDYPVNFINADDVFESSDGSPQISIYKLALDKVECADAIMFLDIDEFWVPSDLQSTIAGICNRVGYFDTFSFQWKNKVEQCSEFSAALESEIRVEHAEQVKTLYRKGVKPSSLNAHNTSDAGLIQLFECGSALNSKNAQHSRVNVKNTPTNAFVLHRKDRSEREYIAMLSRGRPIDADKSMFKSNRRGFVYVNGIDTLTFSMPILANYREYMVSKMEMLAIVQFNAKARKCVLNRYQETLNAIREADEESLRLLARLLRGIKHSEIVNAFDESGR